MLLYQITITLILFAFLGLVVRNLRDYALPSDIPPKTTPLVSICLPVRNEEANVEACLRELMQQTYLRIEILVLNDNSEDATGQIVTQLAQEDRRIRLLEGVPLPPGWAGKCHACWQAVQAAQGEYLLFVDADTRAKPKLVEAAVAVAETHRADMVSGFPRYVAGSFWELAVMPMLTFLITTLLPVRQVWESPSPAFAAACGQFLLFRRDAYCKVGGHAAIRGSFHDGLQLARRLKASGGSVRLFDVSPLLTCRMYDGGRALWNGFTRNAYEGVGSFPVLVGLTLLLITLFLAPFGFLLYGISTGAAWWGWCLAQVGLILLLRGLQSARFGLWASVLLFPLSVSALLAIQWASFLRTRTGRRGVWKGRRCQ